MSAPAWGSDGRPRKPKQAGETRERPTGEIGVHQLADMYFDGAIAPAARRVLEEKLKSDPELRKDFKATRAVVEKLRRPVASPDQTDEILRRVAEVNGFASARTRRRVLGARLAVAACLAGVLGTAVMLRVAFPHAPLWAPEYQPVTGVEIAGRAEAANGVRTITSAVDTLAQRAVAPLGVSAPLVTSKRPALDMHGAGKYETPLTWRIATVPSSASGGGIQPGTVAVFKPDAGEFAMASSATAMAGFVPEGGPDPAIGLKRADAMLKLDRPWWLWPLEDEASDDGESKGRESEAK